MGPLLKKPVKDILFVTVGYTIGGAEIMISRIAPILKMRGYNVRVVVFKGWGPVSEKLKRSGIECIALHGKGRFDLRILWRYFFYLMENPPDLIIAFLYRAYIPTRIFGFLLGIQNISSVRGVRKSMSLTNKFLDKITVPLSHVIYSCSGAVTDFLVRDLGIKRNNIVTIPNGIEVKSFSVKLDKNRILKDLGVIKGTKVVGTVSRLYEPTKGIKILLEAFNIIQGKADSLLLIVGGGKDKKELKQMAEKLKLKALFLGERNDVAEILSIMDVFVLPSLSEGFSVVILEAMACGIPVVATNVGSNREVVLNGKTGFVVEPGNPYELADKIKKLLEDKKMRKLFGKAGFKRVKEYFSLDKTVASIENLWKGALQ
ncbi:glycosyltransferase [candidate division WOR-3 bacterium]|nr:glycosyltransferase [candidate division WOR-3 bacterium]